MLSHNQFKQAIHGSVPRSWLNFIWNLASDLKDLPIRLYEPRPMPWRVIHNVGGGDFYKQSERLFELFSKSVNLQTNHHVLDIGCGAGRLAFPITDYLDADGCYTGFDISKVGLAFARKHIKSNTATHFIHADLANPEYTVKGGIAERYRFPAGSAAIDCAISVSVFTHIRPETVQAYLLETARVLKPRGYIFLTAFLINESVADRLRSGHAQLTMDYLDSGCWVADQRYPERAIGFDESLFLSWCDEAGLKPVKEIERGFWSRTDPEGEFQDILVLERI